MTSRGLLVIDRLSQRGGADRYVRALLRASPYCRYSAVYGHEDESATPLIELLASRQRLPGLSRRGDWAGAGAAASDLERHLRSSDAELVVVQNVLAPSLLSVLASDPRAIHVVQDHRLFCPGRGKVFPDGTPCREPVGPACDRCFATPGGVDVIARDQRLALVGERLRAARGFTATVVLSRYMAGELIQSGLDAASVHVVPPGAPDWPLPTVLIAARGRRVAIVGRLAWHKGVARVVASLTALDARIDLVGDGPEAEALAREPGVSVSGWLDEQGVRARLADAAVMVMPSLWAEPFGIAGLEAGTLGLPVVAYDVGAVHEWLEHERTGLLVAAGDARGLVSATARLLDDRALAARLGGGARHALTSRFAPATFAADWQRVTTGSARSGPTTQVTAAGRAPDPCPPAGS